MPSSSHHSTPELLAPAGDWECLRAAVANGADAVFFGLSAFNARMRAENFRDEELPDIMRYLHDRGVKGYVTLNVLIFSSELESAVAQLGLMAAAGVDAVIIQDVGLARLAAQLVPGLRVHASTQMTVTSPEGAEFAARLGVRQIVLARELSLREIEKFRDVEVPLEVFVHGALCVAYSGQCLTSESLGQRSANRGECAQACRMPYTMIVDGQPVDLGEKHYLLSPQDLAAVREIPSLVQAGVMSFKIEGRLKSPEYVAAVTAVYRSALDAALAEREFTVDRDDWYRLEMTFSRGLYPGWMHGVNHQELVGAAYGKKRGHRVGRVRRTGKSWIEIGAEPGANPVKPGDGLVFENPADTNHEIGGRVYAVTGDRIEFRHDLDLTRVPAGVAVWKTDDPALVRDIRRTFEKDPHAREDRRGPISITVRGKAGLPMQLEIATDAHHAGVESDTLLEEARNRPLTAESLLAQLGRLTSTRYRLDSFSNELVGDVILPISALNRLRQAAVHALDRACAPPVPEPPRSSLPEILHAIRDSEPQNDRGDTTALAVLARTVEQALAAAQSGADILYLDFEDIRRYAAALEHLRTEGVTVPIFLATPRIQKAGEQGFFKLIERAEPDGVLIRNLGALGYFENSAFRRVGDFSLNVANPVTADVFMAGGLERVTVSYDLTAGQVLDLATAVPRGWLELTIHQHMPMFHMEHCAFAAFLSDGTDYTNCGRPCESHRVHLRDRVGVEHPLRADVGCRNTLFNATAQTGAKFFDSFAEAGIRHFRVELLEEEARPSGQIVAAYRALLDGTRSGETLWKDLKARPQLGVTQGTL